MCYHVGVTKNLLARIPEELHARVKAEAEERGISMALLTIYALEEYLNTVHVSADFVIDPRFDPNVGGIVALKISRDELIKLESKWRKDGGIELQDGQGISEAGGA